MIKDFSYGKRFEGKWLDKSGKRFFFDTKTSLHLIRTETIDTLALIRALKGNLQKLKTLIKIQIEKFIPIVDGNTKLAKA